MNTLLKNGHGRSSLVFGMITLILAFTFLMGTGTSRGQVLPQDVAVGLTATVVETPPSITLQWSLPTNHTTETYTIFRKALTDNSWGTPIATLADSASVANTSYKDTSVQAGQGYEYQVIRSVSGQAFTSAGNPTGYIYSGIDVPATESRGIVILLVDNTKTTPLAAQLAQFQSDLVGDGWTVIRHDIDPNSTAASARAIVKNDYTSNANVQALILFGHCPVPFSGTFAYNAANGESAAPDGHGNEQGAWPADVLYGDMTGTYTDTVNLLISSPGGFATFAHVNVPGDGKFDQDNIPPNGLVVLDIGRIDLFGLTLDASTNPSGVFTASELTLLTNYLAKDHAYRFNQAPFNTVTTGVVFGHQFNGTGKVNDIREMQPMDLSAAIGGLNNYLLLTSSPGAVEWIPNPLSTGSYTWGIAFSAGSYNELDDVGTINDYANNTVNCLFTQSWGSYSGDWNNPNDIIRGMIAANGTTLASSWGYFMFYHPMALGATNGRCMRLIQNEGNSLLYYDGEFGGNSAHEMGGVWTDLQGDPTLRLFPVLAPSNLTATPGALSTMLSWTGSTDSPLRGYYVYHSSSATGPFTRLNSSPVAGTQYVDTTPLSGTNYYMVRAIKFQTTPSGTYLNPSQGIFANAVFTPPVPPVLVNAVSRQIHGGTKAYDLNLPLTGTGVEGRHLNGGALQVILTFDQAVTAGTPTLTLGTGQVSGSPVFSGNTMTVNLTGVTDVQKIILGVSGLNGTTGAAALPLGILYGDVNGDGNVNIGDQGLCKAQSGQPLSASNFFYDVNEDGNINVGDQGTIKLQSGHSILP